jgi:hypothetical protein
VAPAPPQPAQEPQQISPAAYQHMPAPPFAAVSNPSPTCYNGVQDGFESDVDCGAGCEFCLTDERCNGWGDCGSGLCVNGRCRERAYHSGDPVPDGYELLPAEEGEGVLVRNVGAVFFAIGYSAAYLCAVSMPSQLGEMYLPVIGPWMSLNDVDIVGYKALLAIDGGLQLGGAALVVAGWLGAGQQLVRIPYGRMEMQVFPQVGPGGGGLGVVGAF